MSNVGIANAKETLAILGYVTTLTVVREYNFPTNRYHYTLIWEKDGQQQKVKFTIDHEDLFRADDAEFYIMSKAKEAVDNARSNK